MILITGIGINSFRNESLAGQSKPREKLITIKYVLDPFRTFAIEGTNLKGVKLDALTSELAKYKAAHQDDEFELYAEVKCTPEESAKIIKAIQNAGIALKHYWAPVSFINPKAKPVPYGSGHEDILKKTVDLMFSVNSPPTARQIELFKKLKKDSSIVDMVTVIGKPDDEVGSGIFIFVYNLDDGTRVLIGAPDLNKPPLYMVHVFKDGRKDDLIKK